MAATGTLQDRIDPESIVKNPDNPRRYFNESRLDLLRTSIQEVGILVPLIVYRDPQHDGVHVLMDGERRWRCSLDLALPSVPVNIIDVPTPLDNLLRMFNIHNVREEWPLIAVTLSLDTVMQLSNETGEKRLAEMTGLTRSAVRRAKRLLTLPRPELVRIQEEAHLDRAKQVHREDLYLEIEAAESVLRTQLPDVVRRFPREHVIRKFAEKAEVGILQAVTDFRYVPKLVKAANEDLIDSAAVEHAVVQLIEDVQLSPKRVFEDVAAYAYRQQGLQRKAEILSNELQTLDVGPLTDGLRFRLSELVEQIQRLLGSR